MLDNFSPKTRIAVAVEHAHGRALVEGLRRNDPGSHPEAGQPGRRRDQRRRSHPSAPAADIDSTSRHLMTFDADSLSRARSGTKAECRPAADVKPIHPPPTTTAASPARSGAPHGSVFVADEQTAGPRTARSFLL